MNVLVQTRATSRVDTSMRWITYASTPLVKMRNFVQNLRRYGLAGTIDLYCYRSRETYRDWRLGIRTAGYIEADALGHGQDSFAYEPINYRCLDIVFGHLEPDSENDVFLDYVLPYAHVNERRDRWRPRFFDAFAEPARRSASIEDAVATLNRVVYEYLGVAYHGTKRPHDNQSLPWVVPCTVRADECSSPLPAS